MLLDGGAIRGGFAAEYGARILPAQRSEVARAIAQAVGSDRNPKIDIEIEPPDGRLWICSLPGRIEWSSVLTTPNPLVVGIATHEGVHLVNVATRAMTNPVVMSIERAASDPQGGRLFLATCIDVVAIGNDGVLWESRQISLDGVKLLTYSDDLIHGIGVAPGLEETTVAFSINATTGEATGGHYLA